MKNLEEAAQAVLSHPTPRALQELQGALLALDRDDDAAAQALEVAGRFYSYLSELKTKIAAREYSELASHLDIGAVGAVALENVMAGQKEHLWKSLLMGGLSEGLMVAASRQYIRAWKVETSLVHTQAAWYLAEALWRTSHEAQPGLDPAERWQAIASLLAPANEPQVPAPEKATLLGRIFQILLLTHLARLLPAS
ncbi:MAG: hypothetical protein EHM56_03990 [Chloroflexi bacterium]|nr:MAG: hypothetical protein EHM56_03990 [Chloroflexota bacterium]